LTALVTHGTDSHRTTMADNEKHDEVLTTLVDAYYRKVVDGPEAARRRAQAAYVVAGAISAALLTAGAFAKLEQEQTIVQVLGPLALGGWLVAAGLYVWAVAVPYDDPTAGTQVTGGSAFKTAVIEAAGRERKEIDRRQNFARVATVIALVLTIGVIVFGLVLDPASRLKGATLQLSPEARQHLSALCESTVPAVIQGFVDPGTAADDSVVAKLAAGVCGPTEVTTSFEEEEVIYTLAP
jgi:hypothetical protein